MPNIDIGTPLMGQRSSEPNLGIGREQDVAAAQLRRDKRSSKNGQVPPGGALSGQGLDSRLMAAGASGAKKGETLIEKKEREDGTLIDQKEAGKAQSSLAASKKAAGRNAAKKALGSKINFSGTKVMTARWFFSAWMGATTVVGAIWTWVYAHLHAAMLILLGPSKVCRFGEEWILGPPGASAIQQGAGSSELQKKLRSNVAKIGLGEKMLLILVDIIVMVSLLLTLFMFFITVFAWALPFALTWLWIKQWLLFGWTQ